MNMNDDIIEQKDVFYLFLLKIKYLYYFINKKFHKINIF